MTIEKTDPRLTAYICNELADADRAEIDRALAADPELAAFVAALKATGDTLTVELAREARDMSLSAAQRAKILRPADRVTPWQKFNAWLTSPRVILSGTVTVSILLVLLVVSVVFTRPPKPPNAEQIAAMPKADMTVFDTDAFAASQPPPPAEPEPTLTLANNSLLITGGGILPSTTPTFGINTASLSVPASSSVSAAPADSRSPTVIGNTGRAEPLGPLGKSHYVETDVSSVKLNGYVDVGYLGSPPANKLTAAVADVRDSRKSEVATDMTKRKVTATRTMSNPFGSGPAREETPTVSGNETYLQVAENPWHTAAQEPLSTFSIDVDTASYSNLRRFLSRGQLPPADAVRLEELLNYFTYNYPPPADDHPFSVSAELARCPWNPGHQLLRIGIQGQTLADRQRPAVSLVFLVDVSGSMSDDNKLPLVIKGLKLLVGKLRPTDRVAIVTYAGESRLALPSTPAADRETILSAIDGLRAAGSTNGEGGIRQAYQVARDNFIANGQNRVILCTDGDFNVGDTGEESLSAMVQRQAKSGVFLNIYGFGMGNYKDRRLVQLADHGNGVYGYIDSYPEAQKIFSKQLLGTLVTIAKDVKIQMDFNPARVGSYRLLGYEKRALANADFKDDRKDAGEIGSGHTVTALYELIPAGADADAQRVEPSKYLKAVETVKTLLTGSAELGTIRLRYKLPQADTSTPFDVTVSDRAGDWQTASVDFKFAAAIALFADALKNPPAAGDLSLALQLARDGKGADTDGYRAEFIRLIETARELKP
ncbi:MAG: von Willebrand factor type A domain-containing protein [Verrucomicrobiales bacterium]|jgi:Ca-activated chloride channel family protein|nr:von Willebrand factor type A domain-containing protein [Verrucomicrobiales bacterium]